MRINKILPTQKTSQEDCKSDKKFLSWLRKLPCCVCGNFSEWINGEGRNQAAHVRLDGRGGMGMKPVLSAVPCCAECHRVQHLAGHTAIATNEWWISQSDLYKQRFFKIYQNNV